MEARATAHYWAHELTKLGHEVRLMPAEAVSRPTMRFVRVKSAEQQVS